MTYNRFLYNEALYNAGREEVGAVARSIIQAHTGPHIQAVVGSSGGVSFISDFTITVGTKTPPPTCFNFPDLKALIKGVEPGLRNLGANIFGFSFKDLPACVFLVDKIPDLAAIINIIEASDLPASIIGDFVEKDLPAILFVPIADLGGRMLGIEAPTLGALIFGCPPADLRAAIASNPELAASIFGVAALDLGATIGTHPPVDLGGRIGPTAFNPDIIAFVRSFVSATTDLGGTVTDTSASDSGDMGGSISAIVNNLVGTLIPAHPVGLGATIGFPAFDPGKPVDLPTLVGVISGRNLAALVSGFAVGERDRFLFGSVQSVNASDLVALIGSNANFGDLSAFLEARSDFGDLSAFLRVSETFVTAILTVNTLSSRDLRVTIGLPECAGGSANANLAAIMTKAQLKSDLVAAIQSFVERDIGAKLNTTDIFHAFDTIDVFYSTTRVRNPRFLATDTIDIVFGPFRGQDLGASIIGEFLNKDLSASLIASFPLLKVSPSVARIRSADLRTDEDFDFQELRLELEGALTDFFYVNGTDQAFIKDFDERWQIDVRSFRPVAENIFGNFGAEKICRLGDLTSFATIDEAVRFCITAVLGLNDQANLTASLFATGGFNSLPASVGISDLFSDLGAFANRVFPAELGATITATP